MMTFRSWALFFALGCWPGMTHGQVGIFPYAEPARVFAGADRPIMVAFHNADDQTARLKVSTEIYQTTSGTAVALDGPRAWKALEVLPGQTILETNFLTFPMVKQATGFLVQWLEGTNRVLGHS